MRHCLTCLLLLALVDASRGRLLSVTYNITSGEHAVHAGRHANWLVLANFTDAINSTGWAQLQLLGRRLQQVDDGAMAFAAGLAEVHATSRLMEDFRYNVLEPMCADERKAARCRRVEQFLQENQRWTREQVKSRAAHDPYWRQVGLVLRQLDGMQLGIEQLLPEAAGNSTALWFNALAEVEDLFRWVDAQNGTAAGNSGDDHCSVIVKLLATGSDLLVGHTTWIEYSAMTRLLKQVALPLRLREDGEETVPGHTVAFSGFPASIASLDDFHITSAGLVSTETTVGNYNVDLWSFVSPRNSVLEWVRATVANRLAADGQQWFRTFKSHNSGTYNNQWMVVDYNRWNASGSLQPGLLWVVEQLPGLVVGTDVTQVLQHDGYWASYNRPYFPIIQQISGYQQLQQEHGSFYSHAHSPRARIFRRDQQLVTDVHTALQLLRYNNYTSDPAAQCNCSDGYSANGGIAARRDLNDPAGSYPLPELGFSLYGAIDAKVTSAALARQLQFHAEAGPTHQQLPAFSWSGIQAGEDARHRGQPDRWNFQPLLVRWNDMAEP